MVFKMLLCNTECVKYVSQQYPIIQILFLQCINQNQFNDEIVRSGIFCMKQVINNGRNDPKSDVDAVQKALSKPEFKGLSKMF